MLVARQDQDRGDQEHPVSDPGIREGARRVSHRLLITKNGKNCYPPNMNVSLTPQLEAMVQKKVKTGDYQTASEVIREGLRLLQQRDAQLRRDVRAGFEQIERGEYIDLDEKELKQFFADIKKRGRERLATAKRRKAS
jgi:antitoxin ParD1/3/4